MPVADIKKNGKRNGLRRKRSKAFRTRLLHHLPESAGKRNYPCESRRLINIVYEKRNRLIDGAQSVGRFQKDICKPPEIFREYLRVHVKNRHENVLVSEIS